MGPPEAPEPRSIFKNIFVRADGVKAANWKGRRLRYVAIVISGGTGTKAQWRVKKLIRG
jgi:hypothetical protein